MSYDSLSAKWVNSSVVMYTFRKKYIQGDSDVFSINKNLNSLQQGDHLFSQAFFTKVLHFRDNRKNVQF